MKKILGYFKDLYSEKEPVSTRFLATMLFIGIVLASLILLSGLRVVPSNSMNPTIESGDMIFNNKIPQLIVYDKVQYERNEIVSFCIESKKFLFYCNGESYVKRVVGLPNEKVQMIDGDLYINDEYIDLGIEIIKDNLTTEPLTLKDNEYYMLGDNRLDSVDSRVLGGIHVTNILGRSRPLWF